jgi:enediyne biosynthesis protein E4
MRRFATAAGAALVVAVAVGAFVWSRQTTQAGLDAPRFVEEAEASGLDHTYGGDSRFSVGGGVATLDCDDDGRPELFLAGGEEPAALYRNESIGGALRFSRLRDAATDLVDVTGAYPLDVDSDGLTDLAVLRAGENVLLRGLGDCRFERANEEWGFDGGDGRTMAFSATWEGDATLPTLAIGDYVGLDAQGTPVPPCPDIQLFRPASDGTSYESSLALAPGRCPLSMLFSDWDRSGRRDLRVSNDRQYDAEAMEQLWRMDPGATPRQYTSDDGWVKLQLFGMGIASLDLTSDGYPEVYLTSQADNKLQTLTSGPAQPTYGDIALQQGVNASQPFTGGEALPSTAWHPEFVDVNNDGFIDLLVTKGNVSQQQGFAMRDPSDLFLGRPDGTFEQGADAAGIVRFDRGRGASVVDLNLDGLPDLVEIFLDAPVGLWRNVGSGSAAEPEPMGNWVGLRLEQAAPNRDGIGSWVEVRAGDRTSLEEVTIGGGHLSGDAGWIHVGIGPSERAEVRITWPDGSIGPWQEVEANGWAIIERGGEARAWEPPP